MYGSNPAFDAALDRGQVVLPDNRQRPARTDPVRALGDLRHGGGHDPLTTERGRRERVLEQGLPIAEDREVGGGSKQVVVLRPTSHCI
jgi:hypothetical protein